MDDRYMTKEHGRLLVKLLIGGMLMFLVLVGIVLYQSVNGRNNLQKAEENARAELVKAEEKARAELIESQRAGCERAKQDRRANAKGWRTAQLRSLSQKQLGFAKIYRDIARPLEDRSKIDCKEAFP